MNAFYHFSCTIWMSDFNKHHTMKVRVVTVIMPEASGIAVAVAGYIVSDNLIAVYTFR